MKKSVIYFGILVVVLLFSASCSSVKVTDTWKDNDAIDFKSKKMLVVSVSDNDASRMRFEKDMVKHLVESGYIAEESFGMFPEISPSKKVKGEALEALKAKLRNDGVTFVLINIVRDVQNYTTTNTSGSSYNTMPYYGHRYHRGFYGYYGGMSMETVNSVTQENTKYILESIVYDLSKPEDKQLQAIITSEIDNPDTVGTASKEFSEKIISELNDLSKKQ